MPTRDALMAVPEVRVVLAASAWTREHTGRDTILLRQTAPFLLTLLLAFLLGCPQPGPPAHPTAAAAMDADRDRITDVDDACPDQPEDHDGDEDDDGCPDPDESSTAVPDVNDPARGCPEGMARESDGGCPTDVDGDGIADNEDSCVDVVGVPSYHGCPSETPAYLEDFRIRIRRQVVFEIDDEDIRPESFATLDDVARVLREHPQITLLRIEGHTHPAAYPRARNLSRDRAEAVRHYLVSRGISRERLVIEGHEGNRPIADPNGPDRALNRRIELHVQTWRGEEVRPTPR